MSDFAFSPTSNPDAYDAWSGSERALEAARRWALESRRSACLIVGAPGMGKTLLLRLLATAAAPRFWTLSFVYPAYDAPTLRELVGKRLGGDAIGSDEALLAALEAAQATGHGVLLLLDEGELLPEPTLAWLREIASRADGALRFAIALTREEHCRTLASCLGDDCEVVRIDGVMSRDEVAAHVRAELERADVEPALRRHFDDVTLDALHLRSEGVPAALQSLASAQLLEARRAQIRSATAKPRHPQPVIDPVATAESAPRRSLRGFAAGLAVGALLGLGAALAYLRLAEREPAGAGVALEDASLLPAVSAVREDPAPAPEPPVVAKIEPPPPPAVPPAPAVAAQPPPVSVSLNADPWARVEVDGTPVGETPIAALPIAPGPHRITARMPDGRVLERDVVIDERNRHVVFR